MQVHVQRLASEILISFVVITLCSVRATFESAVYSVVTDNFDSIKTDYTKEYYYFPPCDHGLASV